MILCNIIFCLWLFIVISNERSEIYRETIAAREGRWAKNIKNLPPVPFFPNRLNKPSVQPNSIVKLEHNTSTLHQSSVPKLPVLPSLPILPSLFFPPKQSSEFPITDPP
jgi:hypothetical protein